MSTLSELSMIMEMDELTNEITPDDGWEAIEDTNLGEGLDAGREALALEPEIRSDLPNCEKAFVFGNPYEAAERVDFSQGDNPYNAKGNCGLVGICNMFCAAGVEMTEDQITEYAIKNELCESNPYGNPIENGATTAEKRWELLQRMGIESDICPSGTTGSLEYIADAVDNGRGVVLRVNAGLLWDYDDGAAVVGGRPAANHCVAVTGYARDAETGEIAGIFIVDSGRGSPEDACRYLTVEEVEDVYLNAYGSKANITREPLKGV